MHLFCSTFTPVTFHNALQPQPIQGLTRTSVVQGIVHSMSNTADAECSNMSHHVPVELTAQSYTKITHSLINTGMP